MPRKVGTERLEGGGGVSTATLPGDFMSTCEIPPIFQDRGSGPGAHLMSPDCQAPKQTLEGQNHVRGLCAQLQLEVRGKYEVRAFEFFELEKTGCMHQATYF